MAPLPSMAARRTTRLCSLWTPSSTSSETSPRTDREMAYGRSSPETVRLCRLFYQPDYGIMDRTRQRHSEALSDAHADPIGDSPQHQADIGVTFDQIGRSREAGRC